MDTSIIIFIITLIFMSFYIFNEARPEGSKFSETKFAISSSGIALVPKVLILIEVGSAFPIA